MKTIYFIILLFLIIIYMCTCNTEKFYNFKSLWQNTDSWKLCRSGNAPGYEGKFTKVILNNDGTYKKAFKKCVKRASINNPSNINLPAEVPDEMIPYVIQELPPDLPFQELPPEVEYPF